MAKRTTTTAASCLRPRRRWCRKASRCRAGWPPAVRVPAPRAAAWLTTGAARGHSEAADSANCWRVRHQRSFPGAGASGSVPAALSPPQTGLPDTRSNAHGCCSASIGIRHLRIRIAHPRQIGRCAAWCSESPARCNSRSCALSFDTRLSGSAMSPKTIASAGHACWQAVLGIVPCFSLTSRRRSRAP